MPLAIRKADGRSAADAGKATGPRLSVVPDVELFAAGTRGGKTFSTSDLDDMARNARDWGHLIKPPVKIGHGELQMLASGLSDETKASEGTGVPKIGTVDWTTVRRTTGTCPVCQGNGKADGQTCPNCKGRGQQDVLKGSLKDVPPSLARLINGRAYDRVSSEVYDNPPEGVPGHGKTLRAVSLLGGNLPVVKTLADLPLAEYAEPLPFRAVSLTYSEAKQTSPGLWTCFSEITEVQPMRVNKCKMLAEAGMDPKILDEMPDHHIDHLAERCYAEPNYDGEPEDLPPEAPPEERTAMSERYRKMSAYAEKGRKKFGESQGLPPAITNPTDPKAATEFAELRKSIDDLKNETARELCQKFAENLRDLGKIQPSELDATGGRTIVDDWLDLDGTQKIHKFSEGGKTVQISARQVAMNRAKARPAVRKYGEQARSGTTPGTITATPTADAATAVVAEHWDTFAEDFTKLKTGKTEFVASFEAARKHDPALTPERFLNVAIGNMRRG